MPTKKLPRWAWPAVFVAVLAVALFFSNQTAPLPQGYGTPITTDEEYVKAFKRAEELSTARIAAYEKNQPLTADDKEKLREAGNLIDRMDAFKPQRASIFLASGKIHHILGEDEVAEQMFRQCVLGMDRQMADESQYADLIRAQGAEAAYQLSLLLVNRHDLQGSLEQADLAVRAAPNSSMYHAQLGSALNEVRRTAEAKQELAKAIKLDPKNERAVSLLRFLSH